MSLEHSPGRQGGVRPRFSRIRTASAYAGISRSGLYLLAPKVPGLFVKFGRNTLVNLEILDSVLDSLPSAAVKAPEDAA
jgi:hypothetical protein